jgi:hypothetical protein
MFSLSHNNYTELSVDIQSATHFLLNVMTSMAKFTIKSTSVMGPVIPNGELDLFSIAQQ